MSPQQPSPHDTPSTHWSLIDGVAAGNQPALDEFLKRYLPALRNYLACVLRGSRYELDDILQQFLQVKLLEQNLVARVNRELGFRKFVFRSLKNFVISHIRSEQRRSADKVSLEPEHLDQIARDESQADAFDVAWADTVLRETLQRVRRECFAKQQERIWEVLETRLLRPLREGVPPPSYDELRTMFRFESPSQAANALETAKRKLRLHLQEVVAEYTGLDPAGIQHELGELRVALAHASGRAVTIAPDLSSRNHATDESLLESVDAPQRLAAALDLSQLDSPLWLPDESADLLREELHCPLEVACDDAFLQSLRQRPSSDQPLPASLAALFGMESPPVWLLELVKRWSKSLLRSSQPAIPREVAYVLHYASICAGLCAGARSITRSSDAEILGCLKLLQSYLWIGPELETLFARTQALGRDS